MISYRTSQPDFNRYLDAIEPVGPADLPLTITSPDYADFESEEFQQRYERLRVLMKLENMDAVLVSQEENVRYFTGFLTALWVSKFRPLVGIVPTDTSRPAGLILPQQERANAEATSWIKSLTIYPAQEPPISYVVGALKERGLGKRRIGLELGFGQRLGMNQEQFHQLVQAMPEVEFVDATPIFQAVRMLKTPAEIERLAMACKISEAGTEAGWRALRSGMTEREILSVMAAKMYELGAEVGTKPSFFGILAGDRWRLANGVASEYRIGPGDLILIDGGATYRGYVCDFIRQACLGRPSSQQLRWFDAVVKATDAAAAVVSPGVACHTVYNAALSYLTECGLVQFNRMNIIGHGLGMDIHELPWIGAHESVYTSGTTLRAGMVLTIEPGITAPDETSGPKGHFIVEDVIVVTPTGARTLTSHLSKAVWIVERG
jgi:Xaa-Pro aminopeptidase